MNLASRVISAARPILKDIAPAYEQKASKGAAQAKESYDSLRGDVVDLHNRGTDPCEKIGRHLEYVRPLSDCLVE